MDDLSEKIQLIFFKVDFFCLGIFFLFGGVLGGVCFGFFWVGLFGVFFCNCTLGSRYKFKQPSFRALLITILI